MHVCRMRSRRSDGRAVGPTHAHFAGGCFDAGKRIAPYRRIRAKCGCITCADSRTDCLRLRDAEVGDGEMRPLWPSLDMSRAAYGENEALSVSRQRLGGGAVRRQR